MTTVELRPLVGCGPIGLGALRNDVVGLLGKPEKSFLKTPKSRHKTDCWFKGAVQVFYCDDPLKVEYIEVSAGSGTEPLVFGQSVFSRAASEVVTSIAAHAGPGKSEENGCSYVFPTLELSLWRSDPEQTTFQTVGIGVRGYYSNAI